MSNQPPSPSPAPPVVDPTPIPVDKKFATNLPKEWNRTNTKDTTEQSQVKSDWLAQQPFPPGSTDIAKNNLNAIYMRGALISNRFLQPISYTIIVISKLARNKFDPSTKLHKLATAILAAMHESIVKFNHAISQGCHNLLHYGKLQENDDILPEVSEIPDDSTEDLQSKAEFADSIWWTLVEKWFNAIIPTMPALNRTLPGMVVTYKSLFDAFLAAGREFFDEWTKSGEPIKPHLPDTKQITGHHEGEDGVIEGAESKHRRLVYPATIEPVYIPGI